MNKGNRCQYARDGGRCFRETTEGSPFCAYHTTTKLEEIKDDSKKNEKPDEIVSEEKDDPIEFIREKSGGTFGPLPPAEFASQTRCPCPLNAMKQIATEEEPSLDQDTMQSVMTNMDGHGVTPFAQENVLVPYEFLMGIIENASLTEKVQKDQELKAAFLENYLAVAYALYVLHLMKCYVDKVSSEKTNVRYEKITRKIVDTYFKLPRQYVRELHIYRDLRGISRFSPEDLHKLYKVFEAIYRS